MSMARSFFISICSVALTLTACQSSDESSAGFPAKAYASLSTDAAHLRVEVRTAPSQPPALGASSIELRVHDAAGESRDGLTLKVSAWMPAHGHGAHGTPVITPLGDGIYRVESLAMTMAGTWQLRIEMTGEGGFIDHATTDLEVQ